MGKGGEGVRTSVTWMCSCVLPTRGDSILLWPDGRAFPITEVLDRGSFGPAFRGVSTARYRVRIGGHVTNLFLERHVFDATLGKPPVVRWWVEAYG